MRTASPKVFHESKGAIPSPGANAPGFTPEDRILIAGGEEPPRAPQPVPEVQAGRTSNRPIPEEAAL